MPAPAAFAPMRYQPGLQLIDQLEGIKMSREITDAAQEVQLKSVYDEKVLREAIEASWMQGGLPLQRK